MKYTIAALLLAPLAMAAPSGSFILGPRAVDPRAVVSVQAMANTTAATPLQERSWERLEKRAGGHQMAAWMYIADDADNTVIPSWWDDIPWAKIDILYIGPAGVLTSTAGNSYPRDAGFAENSVDYGTHGSLIPRLEAAMKKFRAAKSGGGKVIMSQWWRGGSPNPGVGTTPSGIWGNAVDKLRPSPSTDIGWYAGSVGAFMERYVQSPGTGGTTGPIDGWDIDFESRNTGTHGANVLNVVRGQLNWLENKWSRTFWVTASPSSGLSDLAVQNTWIKYVNMQTYDGGYGLDVSAYTSAGFSTSKLFYGARPETCGTGCTRHTTQEVKDAYHNNNLAGIHAWRLNSDNHVDEGNVVSDLADYVHNPSN